MVFHKKALGEREYKHAGRKFGKRDYEHSDESKHLSSKERRDSHYKHDELLKGGDDYD